MGAPFTLSPCGYFAGTFPYTAFRGRFTLHPSGAGGCASSAVGGDFKGKGEGKFYTWNLTYETYHHW